MHPHNNDSNSKPHLTYSLLPIVHTFMELCKLFSVCQLGVRYNTERLKQPIQINKTPLHCLYPFYLTRIPDIGILISFTNFNPKNIKCCSVAKSIGDVRWKTFNQ